MRFQILILLFFITPPLFAQDLGNLNEQKPIQLHGNLNLSVQGYSTTLDQPLQPGLSWYLTGNPTLDIYGFSLPFYFLLSNQQRKIQQPFNEFGISPYYKWAQLHLGYFNPNYSPITLAGKRILGAGVELTPGKLRFAASYGRFRKPIQYQSTPGSTSVFLLPGIEPSYKQTGYAFKLGVGSEKSYIDLIYLKGKDVADETIFPIDSISPPAENAVVGLSYRIQGSNWFSWTTDLALSAYTRDQISTVIADSTFPAQNFISKIIQPRESSQIYSAAQSKVTLGNNPFLISINYRRIDPDYKSMGAYFFQTDVQSFTLAPKLILSDGKYVLSGSIGHQTDNLYQQKVATTKRIIGSGQLILQPSTNFGITAQYSNYGLNQTALNPNLPDTLIITQVSHQAIISPRFSFGEEFKQYINPSFTYFALTGLDENFGSINTWNLNLNYGIQNQMSGWAQQFTILFRESDFITGKMKTIGGLWSIRKSLLEQKLNSNLQLGYYLNRQEELVNEKGSLFILQTRLSYRILNSHVIQLQYSFRRNKTSDVALGNAFKENRGFIIYSFQF